MQLGNLSWLKKQLQRFYHILGPFFGSGVKVQTSQNSCPNYLVTLVRFSQTLLPLCYVSPQKYKLPKLSGKKNLLPPPPQKKKIPKTYNSTNNNCKRPTAIALILGAHFKLITAHIIASSNPLFLIALSITFLGTWSNALSRSTKRFHYLFFCHWTKVQVILAQNTKPQSFSTIGGQLG